MAKFNGRVTLSEFKRAAVRIDVYHFPEDREWQRALEAARTWKQVREVLPGSHPMRPIACKEEI